MNQLIEEYNAGVRDFTGRDLTGIDLSGANLSGANFAEAELCRVSLQNCNLTGTDFTECDLERAYLEGANLKDAVLVRARLMGADLSGSNLTKADLTRAEITNAQLSNVVITGACIEGASFQGAFFIDDVDWSSAQIAPIKQDLYRVLDRSSDEVVGLYKAIQEGQVNGNLYNGNCCCLLGTIAKLRGKTYYDLIDDGFADDSYPIERWALGICSGDTPANSAIARLTAQWIEEWAAANGVIIHE